MQLLKDMPPTAVLALGTMLMLMYIFPHETIGMLSEAGRRLSDAVCARAPAWAELLALYHGAPRMFRAWQAFSNRRQDDLRSAISALLTADARDLL